MATKGPSTIHHALHRELQHCLAPPNAFCTVVLRLHSPALH